MEAHDVLDVLAALDASGLDVWIAGGWGVDAVIGEQTRDHRDLDLAIRAEHVPRSIKRLAALDYAVRDDLLPVRVVVATPDGRAVDLHPVTFGPDGAGTQPGDDGRVFIYPADAFGRGRIDGHDVPSLTADQLVRFHLGYEPEEHDRLDMAVLQERLGIAVPEPYGRDQARPKQTRRK
jgi:lincosamide nucleotidyltransferase A/C/D/E